MDVFKPLKRKLILRHKVEVTLSLPADGNASRASPSDVEVVEMHDDDAWQEWQDSVFVEEFTNGAMQTVPGRMG